MKRKAFKTSDGFLIAIFDHNGPWWECVRYKRSGVREFGFDLIDAPLEKSLEDYYVSGFIKGEIKLGEVPAEMMSDVMGSWIERSGAATLGRKGGSATSKAKTKAARENGKKGGRPKKTEKDNPK